MASAFLGPVADLIDDRIYWIPAGPLLGLPLDAMRLQGHYLAEKHNVTNVLSFPASPDPGQALADRDPSTAFSWRVTRRISQQGYATQFDTTDEIRAMVDIFVGPGLNIVQGAALLPDEFQDQRFKQASLAHLAMPGVIDLHDPARSSLELSGTEDGPDEPRTAWKVSSHDHWTPGWHSSVQRGQQAFHAPRFSSKPGLIADFGNAGARAVIADLWDSAGQSDEVFLADFYRELRGSGDIAKSLHDAKHHYIRNNQGMGLYAWAGYQLFIP